MKEIERRALKGIEVRAKEGDTPKIVGYAAVFNSKSEEMMGFREIILPGAFDRALKEEQDVRALVNHNDSEVLGRTKSGTLKLSVDERGLLAEIEPPDTQAARDVVTSIRRGDIDGMSFAFRVVTDEWRTEDGMEIRELKDVDLFDVSPVTFPAYSATSVSTRAIERAKAGAAPPPGVSNQINEARLRLSR